MYSRSWCYDCVKCNFSNTVKTQNYKLSHVGSSLRNNSYEERLAQLFMCSKIHKEFTNVDANKLFFN